MMSLFTVVRLLCNSFTFGAFGFLQRPEETDVYFDFLCSGTRISGLYISFSVLQVMRIVSLILQAQKQAQKG